jgi:hypothetical protein
MTIITNDQRVPITVSPITQKGKPAKIEGAPLWSSSDVNVLTLEVAQDGLSAFAVGVGEGTATISVIADADLTGAIKEVAGSVEITVTGAPAASLKVTVGTPV